MSKESKEFFEEMLGFLPSAFNAYEESIRRFGEILETVVIEDIFMPKIIKLLSVEDNVQLIKKIFEYFEKVSNSNDTHLINLFSITALEMLGNDKVILEKAKKYMGSKTIELQVEADKRLGRN